MEFLLTAAAACAGGAITALLIFPKALADRETHASNRVLEMRLQALRDVWYLLNDVIWLVSPSMSVGYEAWAEAHQDEAADANLKFKKEVERQQVILDKKVVDGFRGVFSCLDLFIHGEERDSENRFRSYNWFLNERLNPSLTTVGQAINSTMNVSTHQLELRV